MRVILLFLLLVFAADSQASGNLTIWSKPPTAAKTKQLLVHGGAATLLGCAPFGCSVNAPASESFAVVQQEEATAKQILAARPPKEAGQALTKT